MLSTEIHRRIRELVAIGGRNGAGGNRSISRPAPVWIFPALPPDPTNGMPGVGQRFGNKRHAVVIVIISTANIRAVTILEFDFKSVTFVTRVVDRVEIRQTPICDALGTDRRRVKHYQQEAQKDRYSHKEDFADKQRDGHVIVC